MTGKTSLAAAWRRWRRGLRTRDELGWLSDRVLADIGVTRGDIGWLAGLSRRG